MLETENLNTKFQLIRMKELSVIAIYSQIASGHILLAVRSCVSVAFFFLQKLKRLHHSFLHVQFNDDVMGLFQRPPVEDDFPPPGVPAPLPKSVEPPLVEENLNRSPSRLGPVDGSCGAANTNFCKQLLGYSRFSTAEELRLARARKLIIFNKK